MASSSVPSSGGGGLAPKYQKFTSSGTFTLPDGYGAAKPLLVNIQVIGGGGGGSTLTVTYTGNGGGYNGYFGQGYLNGGTWTNTTLNGGGGSGGLCSTQLYLTSNLTVTVGAAGTSATRASTNSDNSMGGNYGRTDGGYNITWPNHVGGTGGTTTASVLQATGGVGGYQWGGALNVRYNGDMYSTMANTSSGGAGGTPAGTTGQATPLLGTLAGGSNSTTPVRGSFGIGGVTSDNTVSTGAEGTGGGTGSIGASGAVILTWWQ
jgi:hypothetical protein